MSHYDLALPLKDSHKLLGAFSSVVPLSTDLECSRTAIVETLAVLVVALTVLVVALAVLVLVALTVLVVALAVLVLAVEIVIVVNSLTSFPFAVSGPNAAYFWWGIYL